MEKRSLSWIRSADQSGGNDRGESHVDFQISRRLRSTIS
jgi:hypothetical protein